MHSTVSDGWRDPDEVAHLAADRGVRVMALTDHDTFRGVDRARSVAHRRGLGYVRALEVTTFPPNQMRHILGHGVDLNHPRLLALLDRTQGVFRRQTEAWIEVLREEVLPLVDGLEAYTLRHKPEQIPVYEELAGRHRLLMTVGSDYHGFNGDDYEAPKKLIDIRYLEKLGSRVEWPVVERAG